MWDEAEKWTESVLYLGQIQDQLTFSFLRLQTDEIINPDNNASEEEQSAKDDHLKPELHLGLCIHETQAEYSFQVGLKHASHPKCQTDDHHGNAGNPKRLFTPGLPELRKAFQLWQSIVKYRQI